MTDLRKALVIVDVQRDFLPGGALGVADGDRALEHIVDLSVERYEIVVASGDCHPQDHCSFVENGGSWPTHCVRQTQGAEIHPDVVSMADSIVAKGLDPDREEYSAATQVAAVLGALHRKIEIVDVVGIATDYCVLQTALGLAEWGFQVRVLWDCCASVSPQGEASAREQLQAHPRVRIWESALRQ